MRSAALGFALGVWLLQQQPALPGPGGLCLAALAGFAALALAGFSRRAAVVAMAGLAFTAFAVFGFTWAAMLAHVRLADRLDAALEGRDATVTGVIASLPQPFERGVRFDFDVESASPGVPRHIALSWYNGLSPEYMQPVPPVRAGERWRFTLRLRRPHGNANPHGFDYEAWLLERGIRATGYVRSPATRRALDEREQGAPERLTELVPRPQYRIERLRESVREKFRDALPEQRYAGVLVALAVGDQNAIPPDQWQLFARTGVSHLMSISGLHVTMVAGLFAAFVFWCWRRSETLALVLPAQKAAALAGFLGAFAYCVISGFAVPAQRTLYMVGVVALALWLGRASSASRVLALALLIVLALDPWAVLAPGFWLSFAAVALIFYIGTGRVAQPHWLVQWGRVQWAVTIGLAPLLLVLFQQASIVSPVANAIAIPLVSFVITPLALLGAVLPMDWPLALAHTLLEIMMAALTWLAALPSAVWHQHAPLAWTVVLAVLGIIWLLLPRGFPARWLGVLLALPIFALAPPGPRPGELWLTVLDVGQGLAVLARTERHALLFDAGPRFSESADSGSRVILPYLRSEGIDRLDALVVSHDDNDHAGGAQSLLDALPVDALWASLPADHALLAAGNYRLPCLAGRRWRWDGVAFEFLHPGSGSPEGFLARVNNRSCVLRIEGGGGRVLITGDIELAAERQLLQRAPGLLTAEVLLVPHHGSKTSSSPEFVRQVAPHHAVFTVGYRNRFGHPRAEVLERYRAAGSSLLRTDESGALQMRFGAGSLQIAAQRDSARRYWQEP
jgi:competence protein ComEC